MLDTLLLIYQAGAVIGFFYALCTWWDDPDIENFGLFPRKPPMWFMATFMAIAWPVIVPWALFMAFKS